MPSSEPSPYADLEIRIFEQQHDLYPVELTLDSGHEFPRGYLNAGTMPQAAPEDDNNKSGEQLFAWLLSDEPIRFAWEQVRHEYPNCRIRLRIDAEAPQLHTLCWERIRETPPDGTAIYLAATVTTPFIALPGGNLATRQPDTALADSNPGRNQQPDRCRRAWLGPVISGRGVGERPGGHPGVRGRTDSPAGAVHLRGARGGAGSGLSRPALCRSWRLQPSRSNGGNRDDQLDRTRRPRERSGICRDGAPSVRR